MFDTIDGIINIKLLKNRRNPDIMNRLHHAIYNLYHPENLSVEARRVNSVYFAGLISTVFGLITRAIMGARAAMFFVLFGWLLFVFEDLGAGFVHLGNMFGVGASSFISQANIYDITRSLLFFAVCVLASTPLPKKIFYKFYEVYQSAKLAAYIGGAAVLIFAIAYLVSDAFNPFLYFRF